MPRRHSTLSTELGDLLVVADDEGLKGIYFPAHWHPPAPDSLGAEVPAADDPLFVELGAQLADYLAGARREFELPIAAEGDAFEQKVWAMLREIPFGETTTYGELALRLGDRNLARMVGRAVGHNPVSILVPCHRVVGTDGSLTGYAGGLERKRALLELEGAQVVAQRRLF
jgi:methylated-DNA-[protein]-cysteine S-methyltransferase